MGECRSGKADDTANDTACDQANDKTGEPTRTAPPYLATTAELSRRLARIYTTLGTQDPLYRRFCLYRDRDFRESQIA
ncbi:hypothetical protein [Streptomyces tubercidicus]|uniref:hypothetical protein n=1 Tax=Streptomyces tubercidicus TaxID=47759 RepID=UPI00378D2A3F